MTGDALQNVLEIPPSQIQEIYYECTQSQTNAILNSIGICLGWIISVRSTIIIGLTSMIVLAKRR